MTPNRGSDPQFGETVYISEVTGARKVKANVLVAMNKNSDPLLKLFPYGVAGQDSDPELKFFRTSGIVRNESS